MALNLTPKTNNVVEDVVEDEEFLKELVNGFGSPLNVILPENFSANVEAFKKVFDDKNVEGRIFYAHKANKSEALVAQARKEGIGIDVASENELKDAVSKGFTGEDILATGPKNQEFIELSVLHGCTLHIDNLEELDSVQDFAARHGKTASVLIRLTDFSPRDRGTVQKHSRFGVPVGKKDELIDRLQSHQNIEFEGFAFHLDTSNMRKRIIAIGNVFDLVKEFKERGLQTEVIDVGGGMRVRYLESKEEWREYLEAVQKSVAGKREGVTWNNHSFGLKAENQSVKGSIDVYDYYNSVSKEDYLEKLLEMEVPGHNRSFRDLLKDYMVDLYIEPGRALLDLVGLTVGKVNFVKEEACGEKLVGLDMNCTNINPGNSEMMVDPEIISTGEREETETGVFFVGNLCLESDFIYKHKTYLDKEICRGDLVVFYNTAAYHMDFQESRTIKQDTADKVAVYGQKNWKKDSLYTGNEIR